MEPTPTKKFSPGQHVIVYFFGRTYAAMVKKVGRTRVRVQFHLPSRGREVERTVTVDRLLRTSASDPWWRQHFAALRAAKAR